MSDKTDPITERDLRLPEFRDVDIEDLERRDDGTIARKDRWERGIRELAGVVGIDPRAKWEVVDVINRVREWAREREQRDVIVARAQKRGRGGAL